MEQKEPVWNILHKLWTKAREAPGYEKNDWMELEHCIIAMRNKRDSLQTLYEMRRFLIEEVNNVYRKIGELEATNSSKTLGERVSEMHEILSQPTTTPNPSHRDVHSSELGGGKTPRGKDT